MSVNYRAAWVPEQKYRDWEDAAAIAVEHVEQECANQDLPGLLVTHADNGKHATPSIAEFVRRHGNHITRGSRNSRPNPGPGPTLVYVPHVELLAQAADYARESSLCVVETSSFRLDGWASATAALNLDTGETAVPPPDDAAETLDRLASYGNNGWSDSFGKQQARRLLVELRGMGVTDADFIAGFMIGKGSSDSGAKRLHGMVEKVAS